MIAYVANGMLIMPLLGLTTIKGLVESQEPGPWLAFGWSIVILMLVAFTVRFFARRKLFWRS